MSKASPLLQLNEHELLDTLYKTLANRKRRNVLRYLTDHPEPISISQLATEMVALEYGSDSSAISTEQKEHTNVSLLHVHLPVLDEAGLVSWDRDSDSVAISHDLEKLVVTTTGNVLDLSVSVK